MSDTKTLDCAGCGDPFTVSKYSKSFRCPPCQKLAGNQYCRNYYGSNPEKFRTKRKARWEDPVKRTADTVKHLAWVDQNRDHVNASVQAWRDANRDSWEEYMQRWRETHREHARAYDSARRAQQKLSPEDRVLSIAYRQAIVNDQCQYCGGPGEHFDHFFPLAHGGTDHWWNLVRACAFCNHSKHAHCGTWFKLKRGVFAQ
jgi:5-methylcytosine-specific restriction endonuclease McrA